MALPAVVKVETANGIEFLNLSLVRRFVPGADDTLELRFGQAETLVLTGANARRVLAWATAQAESLELLHSEPEPAQTPAPSPVKPQQRKRTGPQQKRVELIQLKTVAPSDPLTPPLPLPETTLNSTADSARLTTGAPSPTINRQNWTPQQQ